MKQLLQEIQASVAAEYDRAAAKFGPAHASPHESYAVILEEFEEAQEAEKTFAEHLNLYWWEIKSNSGNTKSSLETMQLFAEHAAAEWVQVAAMCHKATVESAAAEWVRTCHDITLDYSYDARIWILHGCSECGYRWMNTTDDKTPPTYCPGCGAKIEKEEINNA